MHLLQYRVLQRQYEVFNGSREYVKDDVPSPSPISLLPFKYSVLLLKYSGLHEEY